MSNLEDSNIIDSESRACAELLLQQYKQFLWWQTVQSILTRVVMMAALMASIFYPSSALQGLFITVGAILFAGFTCISQFCTESRRTRLEELLFQQLERENPWQSLYIKWRQEDWKQPIVVRITRLEPLFWIATIALASAY
jgi:hypothetical protein